MDAFLSADRLRRVARTLVQSAIGALAVVTLHVTDLVRWGSTATASVVAGLTVVASVLHNLKDQLGE